MHEARLGESNPHLSLAPHILTIGEERQTHKDFAKRFLIGIRKTRLLSQLMGYAGPKDQSTHLSTSKKPSIQPQTTNQKRSNGTNWQAMSLMQTRCCSITRRPGAARGPTSVSA